MVGFGEEMGQGRVMKDGLFEQQPRALYVHVPFCGSKCAYCGFASHVPEPGSREKEVQGWLATLGVEVGARLVRRWHGQPMLRTVFIGGGTPTFLTESELEALMSLLDPYMKPAQEITVEANPDSLTSVKADVLKRYGVNRVSLGVQSLDETLLRTLGRRHSPGDVRRAVSVLREQGFANINFDLMFGLPEQDIETWQRTVTEAVRMEPEHLSLYGLTVEPGTVFANLLGQGASEVPNDDDQADMYDWAVDYLADKGYRRYEISNFSREGFTCNHNEAIWHGDDYLGLGPAAVSTERGVRMTNAPSVATYIREMQSLSSDSAAVAVNDTDLSGGIGRRVSVLSVCQQMSEYMFLGLRTTQGVSKEGFLRRFGVEAADIFDHVLVKYSRVGVLAVEADRIFMQPQYFFVANSVLNSFILEE